MWERQTEVVQQGGSSALFGGKSLNLLWTWDLLSYQLCLPLPISDFPEKRNITVFIFHSTRWYGSISMWRFSFLPSTWSTLPLATMLRPLEHFDFFLFQSLKIFPNMFLPISDFSAFKCAWASFVCILPSGRQCCSFIHQCLWIPSAYPTLTGEEWADSSCPWGTQTDLWHKCTKSAYDTQCVF